MAKNDEKPLEPTVEDMPITRQILVIRDKQVMLDRDLATLYGVETKVLNQAVKRNQERFPERNCFQLTRDELPNPSKSQIVTLNVSGNKRGSNVKNSHSHSQNKGSPRLHLYCAVKRLFEFRSKSWTRSSKCDIFCSGTAVWSTACPTWSPKCSSRMRGCWSTTTFFFTKEDFTLDEALKKSEEKRIELEQQPR
jgi:hypothetical protein